MENSITKGLNILAIHHIDEDPESSARIAISPATVKLVASRDIQMNGRDLKSISIHFMDGEVVGFNISGLDLMNLEEVVAGYSFGEY